MEERKQESPTSGVTNGGQGDSQVEPPPSEVMTMFMPYNSFKNSDTSSMNPSNTGEAMSERTDPGQVGGARVFLKKLFGSAATDSTTPPGTTPTLPRKTVPVMKPASFGNQGRDGQGTVLVRPKVSVSKQANRTSQVPSMNMSAPSKTPPSSPTHQSIARWNTNTENVALESQVQSQQLSLTSYSQPQRQVNKSEVMIRFGQFEADKDMSGDLKKYWMPDNACKNCSDCNIKFSLFVRRHHCRICGRIYCNNCCSETIPASELKPQLQGNLRVCKECRNLFREFHLRKPKQDATAFNSKGQSSDSAQPAPRQSVTLTPTKGQVTSGDQPPSSPGVEAVIKTASGTFNPRVIAPRPVSALTPHKSWDDASGRSGELDMSPSRAEFSSYRLGRRSGLSSVTGFDSLTIRQREDLLDLDEDELEAIVTGVWMNLLDPEIGLARQNHRYRLRNFPNTYNAHSLVEWLVVNQHVRSREVAVRVCQALVDTKRLKIVSTVDSYFRDDGNLFLELGEAAKLLPHEAEGPLVSDAPKWFQHLRDDEEMDSNRGEIDEVKGFIHVPPPNTKDQSGLVVSSVTLQDKRQSRPLSYTSLGRGETEEEYLVIDREHSMKAKQDPPYFPTIPSMDSPSRQSFSLIGNEEIVQSLPVDGLSAATEAAKECADDKSKKSITSDKAMAHYEKVHDQHFNTLVVQMMRNLGLNLQWLNIIRHLVTEACRNVRTDVFPDDQLDINHYVKIKKIPRGNKNNSSLVYGVVCTKNVTHKKMLRSIKNPKILLLKCAFEFERKENQLSSFDTLQLQEEKYLKNLVVKVNNIKPNLILVQRSVSRLALEMLFDLGIVVAVNVKPSVMNRVARSTKGEILHSLDQLFFGTSSIFGTCGEFYIKNFALPDGEQKTLMYFDHCPPQLGCVITLQGAPLKELKKVKKVTQFALHVAHNSILEAHFLVDEFAWPSEEVCQPPAAEDYSSTCSTPESSLYPSLGFPLDSLSSTELQRKLETLKFVQIDSPLLDSDVGTCNKDSSSVGVEIAEHNKEEPAVDCCEEDQLAIKQKDEQVQLVEPASAEPVESGLEVSDEKFDEQKENPNPKVEIDPTPPSLQDKAREVSVQPYSGPMTNEILDQFAEEEFKLAYQSQVLSISPYVKFKTPYLQTPKGRSADVRLYLPGVIYWSYQFKARNLLKYTQKLESKSDPTNLEMGLTKNTVQSTVELETDMECQSVRPQPSYKSVSTHPFTSSIFIFQASSNEMKAALADFRSRAGYQDEPNNYLFESAERASNYHLYLKNVFSDYPDFELAADALEQAVVSSKREVSKPSGVVRAKKNLWERELAKRKAKDPFKRLMAGRKPPKPRPKPVKQESDVAINSNKDSINRPSDETDSKPLATEVKLVISNEEGEPLPVEETKEDSDESEEEDLLSTKQPRNRDSSGIKLLGGNLGDFERNRKNNESEDEQYGEINYDTWQAADEQVDCFDPVNHQGLSILFSNTAHDGLKHQVPCVAPCVIPMFYYGRNDISLGEFLHRYCFRPFYRCQTCGADMVQHQRHVIHADSAIHVSMQQLVSPLPGNDGGIYTWLACKYCDQCTPYTEMSKDSLLFSFAKFLELKFHCDSYVTRYHSDDTPTCSHSLHRDYVQYFLHKDKITAFQPDKVDLLEILVPPRSITIETPRRRFHLDFKTEIKHIQRIVEGVFYRIGQKLEKYRLEPVAHSIDGHIANSKAERDALRSKVRQLKDLVVTGVQLVPEMNGEREKLKDFLVEAKIISDLQDSVADLKRCVADLVDCWNIHLEDLDSRVREFRRNIKENIGVGGDTATPTTATPTTTDSAHPVPDETSRDDEIDLTSNLEEYATPPFVARQHSRNLSDSGLLSSQTDDKAHKRQLSESAAFSVPPVFTPESGSVDYLATVTTPSDSQSLSETMEGEVPREEKPQEHPEQDERTAVVPVVVSEEEPIAKPVSGDFISTATSREVDDVQPDSGGLLARFRAPAEGREDPTKFYLLDPYLITTAGPGLSRHSASHSASPHPDPGVKSGKKQASNQKRSTLQREATESEGGRSSEKRPKEKSGVLSRPYQRLPAPFPINEHHTMHSLVTIPIGIYEKEPTSIIAFSLSSREYKRKLALLLERTGGRAMEVVPTQQASPSLKRQVSEAEKAPPPSANATTLKTNFKAVLNEFKKKGSAISLFSGSASISTNHSSPESADPFADSAKRNADFTASTRSFDPNLHSAHFSDPSTEAPGAGGLGDEVDSNGKTTPHISLEFSTPDKSASFFCKVYYAEEFRQLRESIFPAGEESFIRSLSRCVKYDAKGGKSRSAFCKVADDRFILKQVKSIEISSFELFAPHYLHHVTKALEEKRPLTIAKIFGGYSIGFRNSKTGSSKRLDVLVMENLLYGHSTNKVFDLKGSMRSRYVDPTKESSGDVLLDENYLNFICCNPVYVHPHSKCVLMQAILADTEFLSQNGIMDYSLLTCIDGNTGELVVGIIDYIRTFTLDKRLEMYLKKTSGKVLPTVVYPELYRKRFVDAMDRYFTVVPDKWTGLGADVHI